MTSKQKASIKHNIKQKYTKGELAYYEYNDLVDQLQVLFDNGATLQEANAALGLTKAGKKAAAAAKTAPAATPAQAATGMTQAEYNAKKSEMYKKYKAGEITNYAYIQWKKQNDPSKNPAASTSAAGASASTGTPMTIEEKQELKQLLHDMADNGTINAFEYSDKLNWLIHNQMKVSAQEAKVALGIATPAQSGTGSASSPDPGTVAAQQAESEIEKKLKKVYKQAQKEIKEKLKDWEDKHQAKDAEMLAKLNAGEITQAQYDAWKKNALATGNIWKQKLDQVSGVLLNANQQAMAIINGEKMGVFAENASFAAYQITQDAGMELSFAIYDADAVGNLIQNEPELLPRKVVNGKKDKAWNQKKMAGALAQGIIQGESIPQLAARIARDTASDNMTAMMRYARTAMTGAQNAGRMMMLERAKGMGIGVKKKWLCTLDGRTRDAHRNLDGQVVDVDKPFKSDLGDIMYPGDPSAAPGNVYNCRCTLIYEYAGFPNDPEFDQRRDQENNQVIQNMTYNEWKAAKEGSALNDLNQAKVTLAQAQKAVVKHKIKEDKVYSDIWKDDVTLADYPAKKGSIDAKRNYYAAEIDKLEDAIANGASWASPDKLKELKKKLKLLNEFELNGQIIEERDAALAKVQDIYTKVGIGQTATAPQTAAQVKATSKKAAPTKAEIKEKIKKLSHYEDSSKPYFKEEYYKKNQIPMADKKAIKDVLDVYQNMSYEEGQKKFAQATIDVSKLKTEQGFINAETLEKMVDAFGGKAINGLATADDQGIRVIKYKGEYILVDGNHRANLAMLQGQKKLDVMLYDLDNPSQATAAQNGQFAADAWDAKTKKKAKAYTSRKTADKDLRKELDAEWDSLSDAEKYAVWEYTHNSEPMNKSLSGYHDGWNRRDFIGYDKTDWGHEDSWRTIDVRAFEKFAKKDGHVDFKKAITDLTNAIEKAVFKEDRWLVRGSDAGGFAGMMEGGGMKFDQVKQLFDGRHSTDQIKKALVGQSAKNHAFTSTGIADDAGFSGEIKYKIYAPKGTKGVYAEPQSYYGQTADQHMYKTGESYSSVGSEAEVILQRGTVYRILDIKEKSTGFGSKSWEIEMEIVEQPDYFTHGDEDTYNNGKTRHKR